MQLDEYRDHDATSLAHLVADKQVTPLELIELAIQSIELSNPGLNAVVHRMYDRARRRVEAGVPRGPLAGVPFLLKDLLADYAGTPTTKGSNFYGNSVAAEHSALVSRYVDAGLVVLGKTNAAELGILPVTEPPRYGPTRNPWDVLRTAGGSSGGSAAAVASAMVPMASGGDGGGSIRIPASCCGIFGLKPTRGRNPTSPYVEDWEGLTQEHVLTRSVRDSAAALDITNRPHPENPYYTPAPQGSFVSVLEESPRKLRIACSAEPMLGRDTHPDCRNAVEAAAALLRELGHDVFEAAPSVDRREFIQNWIFMIAGQVAADVRARLRQRNDKARRDEFHPTTWLSRTIGDALPAGAYVDAVRGLKQVGRRFGLFLESCDAWLCPTLGKPPIEHGALDSKGLLAIAERAVARFDAGRVALWSGRAAAAAEPAFDFASYTPLANVGGQPSMSVPLHWNSAQLPIGVLLTSRFGDDALLLRLARQLEEARPWFAKRPVALSRLHEPRVGMSNG